MNDIIRRVLVKFPLFGHCVANLTIEKKESIDTACTDGQTMFYNPEFLAGLTNDEQVFLVAHEICHVVLNHIERSKGKNPKLWNIATDAVINACLQEEGLPMIQGGVNIPMALHHDAEEMYELLEKEQERRNQQEEEKTERHSQEESEEDSQENSENNDSNSSKGDSKTESKKDTNELSQNDLSGIDIDEISKNIGNHEIWKEAVEKKEKEEREPNQSGEQEESQKKESLSKSEKDFFAENKKEKQKKLEEMKKKIIQESAEASRQGGMLPGGGELDVEYEMGKKGVIDWKKILLSSLKGQVYDWRLGREVRYGVIPYQLKSQPKPVTEILLDTSGSISHTLLRNFMRECRSLLKESTIRVGCFDTEFYGFHEIRNEKDIENMRFEGGGGTNFDVAVEAFSPSAENKIIFTDGDAAIPKKRCNATWIVFDFPYFGFNPPGGKVIQMSMAQYDELCFEKEEHEKE